MCTRSRYLAQKSKAQACRRCPAGLRLLSVQVKLRNNFDGCADWRPVVEPPGRAQGHGNAAVRALLPPIGGVIVLTIGSGTIDGMPPGVVQIVATRLPFHSIVNMRWRIPVGGFARERRMESGRAQLLEDVIRPQRRGQGRAPGKYRSTEDRLTILICGKPLLGKTDDDDFSQVSSALNMSRPLSMSSLLDMRCPALLDVSVLLAVGKVLNRHRLSGADRVSAGPLRLTE